MVFNFMADSCELAKERSGSESSNTPAGAEKFQVFGGSSGARGPARHAFAAIRRTLLPAAVVGTICVIYSGTEILRICLRHAAVRRQDDGFQAFRPCRRRPSNMKLTKSRRQRALIGAAALPAEPARASTLR